MEYSNVLVLLVSLLLCTVSFGISQDTDCPPVETDDSKLLRCDDNERQKEAFIETARLCPVRCYNTRQQFEDRYSCQPGLYDVKSSPNNRARDCVSLPSCPPLNATNIPRCTTEEKRLKYYKPGTYVCPVLCFTQKTIFNLRTGPFNTRLRYVCRSGLIVNKPNRFNHLYECVRDPSLSTTDIPEIVATATTTELTASSSSSNQITAVQIQSTSSPGVVTPTEEVSSTTDPNSSESCPPLVSNDEAAVCTSSLYKKKYIIESPKQCVCGVKCFTRQSYAGAGFGPKSFHTRYRCCDGLKAEKVNKYRYDHRCV